MNRYSVQITLTVEIDAFSPGDAGEAIADAAYEIETLGATVINCNIDEISQVS